MECLDNENEKIFAKNNKFTDMQLRYKELYETGKLKRMEINKIDVDVPCCCLFTDMELYRAVVTYVNYIERTVRIRYVDYGNEEQVGFDE